MTEIRAAVTCDQELPPEPPQNTTPERHFKSEETQPPADSKMDSETEETQESSGSGTDTPQIVQSCPLMKLSGELRNSIYRYVLLEVYSVQVGSTGFSTNGGLLLTCKEIRAEARDIFYLENEFEYVFADFDSQPISKFWDVVPRSTSLEIAQGHPRRPCWSNLMVWAENVHARTCDATYFSPEEAKERGIAEVEYFILGAMFKTAEHLDELPWAKVKPLVEMHRPALIELDPDWEIDG